MAAEP